MASASTLRFRIFSSVLCLFAATTGASMLSAQAAAPPIPVAGLVAGGAQPCSESLPVNNPAASKLGDGCRATQSTINTPVGVAADAQGNVYIADQSDHLIRVVYNGGKDAANAIIAANVQQTGLTPQKGHIYTLAGGPSTPPAQASLYYCDGSGSGRIAENHTLAGCPGTQTYVAPRGVAVDADGNVFFSNVGIVSAINVIYVGGEKLAALIQKENPSMTAQAGFTYTIAGTATFGYGGDGSLGHGAMTNSPRGVYVDARENVYFADNFNSVIRKVDGTTGLVSTVAGHSDAAITSCAAVTSAGDGSAATSATLACPYAEWLDKQGNLFLAEGGNGTTLAGRVRVVYAAGKLAGVKAPKVGNIYTYAGGPASGKEKATTEAQLAAFQNVFGVSVDPAGALLITDYRSGQTGSNKIWRVDPATGAIASIAGNSGAASLRAGTHCAATDGPVMSDKYGDGCPATLAYLNNPQGSVAFDASGTFYVADRASNVVRSFSYKAP